MSKIIIVADDLTGANATSILLKKAGYEAATFLELEKYDSEKNKDLDVISISTDSRAIDGEEAYRKVKEVVEYFKDEEVKFFCKRIDSTLRGNIGREARAILDSLGNDYIAMVLPAFPSSGRQAIGGHLLVDNIPLSLTGVAKDPKNPINHSNILTIIEKDFDKEIGLIRIDTIIEGKDAILKEIKDYYKKDIRMIVFDAMSDKDIDEISEAIADSKLPVITVDPGPLTATLAEKILKKNNEIETLVDKKIMLTIGSVTGITRKQINKLKKEENTFLVEVDTEKLIYDDSSKFEIDRVVDLLLKNIEYYSIFGAISTSEDKKILDLNKISKELNISEDKVSGKIADGLGLITEKVLKEESNKIHALYTSGGDITVATCKRLAAVGIHMVDEILPLAVYGRLKEGSYDKMPIVTKGGLIGNEDALLECIEYIRRK